MNECFVDPNHLSFVFNLTIAELNNSCCITSITMNPPSYSNSRIQRFSCPICGASIGKIPVSHLNIRRGNLIRSLFYIWIVANTWWFGCKGSGQHHTIHSITITLPYSSIPLSANTTQNHTCVRLNNVPDFPILYA